MHHFIFPTIITIVMVSSVTATTYQKDRVIHNLPLVGAPALGFGDVPINVIQQGGNLPVHGGSGRSDPFVGPVSRLDIIGGSHVGPHKPIIPPKKPIVHPKKPIVHPKKPIVHPKKPIVHPKKPIVHPKKPIIDPFKSIDPFDVRGFHPGSHIGQGKVAPGFDHKGLGTVDHRFKKPSPVFPQAY
ncbi:hypothetical protein CHS0354_007993 [Potamilus streckersoni]|uniref:Uncharacterized protein n=1 Tax=Potamilus streckersoni TaxID=2493646 RepID=A0AAE0SBW0_9BIVA|nr:hypothetical protein CHS0354_007993 [Potamilus streckersoni]